VAAVEIYYRFHDQGSRPLDRATQRAERFDRTLKSIEDRQRRMGRDRSMEEWGRRNVRALDSTSRALITTRREAERLAIVLRVLGSITARPKVEPRGLREALSNAIQVAAIWRSLGGMTARPRIALSGAGTALGQLAAINNQIDSIRAKWNAPMRVPNLAEPRQITAGGDGGGGNVVRYEPGGGGGGGGSWSGGGSGGSGGGGGGGGYGGMRVHVTNWHEGAIAFRGLGGFGGGGGGGGAGAGGGAVGGMRMGPFGIGGKLGGGILAAAPFLGPLAVQGIGAGLGAAGGAIGAAIPGMGAAAAMYGAAGGLIGTTMAGAKPIMGQVSPVVKALMEYDAATKAAKPGTEAYAEAQEKLSTALAGVNQRTRATARLTAELITKYREAFTTGERATRQHQVMNQALRLAGREGVPLLTQAWERFFPVIERNMNRLRSYFAGGGRSEMLGWMEGLPDIADNMVRMAGSAARLFGGIVRGFSPLANRLTGGLAGWFGDRADWANSAQGMARMEQIGRQALPIFQGLANVARALGKGFLQLLGGNSGRAAAYILNHLATVSIPAFVTYIDKAAQYTPQFVQALGDLASAAGTLFGPHSGFMLGMTALTGFARLLADITKLLGPVGQGIAALASSVYLFNRLSGGALMAGLGAGAASAAGAAGAGAAGAAAAGAGGSRVGRFFKGFLGIGGDGGPLKTAARMGGRLLGGAGLAYGVYSGISAATGGGNAGTQGQWGWGSQGYARSVLLGGPGYKNMPIYGTRARDADSSRTRAAYPQRPGESSEEYQARLRALPGEKEQIGTRRTFVPWKRDLEGERQIRQATRDRGRTVRELLQDYRKISGQIEKARAGHKNTNFLLSEQKSLMQQIAQTAPETAQFSPVTGRLTGINERLASQVGSGAAGALGRRGALQAYRRLGRTSGLSARATRGILNAFSGNARGLLGSARNAVATGDMEALARLVAASENEQVSKASDRWMPTLMRHGAAPQVAGETEELYNRLRELGVSNRRLRRITRWHAPGARARRREERQQTEVSLGGRAAAEAAMRDGRGPSVRRDDGAAGVNTPQQQRRDEREAWRQGRAKAEKHADGISDRRSLRMAETAAEDVMRKSITTWNKSEWHSRAKNRGAGLTKSFAAGMRRAVSEASKAADAIVKSAVRAFDGAVDDASGGVDHKPNRKRNPRTQRPDMGIQGDAPSPQAGSAHAAGVRLGQFLMNKAVKNVGGNISPGGGWGGSEGVVEGFIPIASRFGVSPGSTKRATKNTASGGISDHWIGNKNAYAIDFPVAGERGDQLAAAIGRKLGTKWAGGSWLNVNRNGYRIQVGWKVPGHYDHVHIGASKQGDAPNRPKLGVARNAAAARSMTPQVSLTFTGDINVRNKAEYDDFVRRLRSDLEVAFHNDASHSAEMTGA
jgi:hypothetical protein